MPRRNPARSDERTLTRDTIVDYLRHNIRLAEELEREGNSTNFSQMESVYGRGNRYDAMGSTYEFIPNRDRVAGIHNDISVPGGLELTREGTPERFWSSYHELERIQRNMERFSFRSGNNDSTHIHAMTAQNIILPYEVLLNAHQLFRYYLPGILLLTGTGGGGKNGRAMNRAVARYANPMATVQQDVPNLDTLYHGENMETRRVLLDKIRDPIQLWYGRDRYTAENLTAGTRHGGNTVVLRGTLTGDTLRVYLRGLHIEYRIGDSSSSPAQIAALRELYRALIIKAAKIYQDTGEVMQVRSSPDDPHFREVVTTTENITMADGVGQTPSSRVLRFAQENARSLLMELSEFLDPEPLAVLSSIAEHPISERLHRNGTDYNAWHNIDADLRRHAEVALDEKRALLSRLSLSLALPLDIKTEEAIRRLNEAYHNAGGIGDIDKETLEHMGFTFNEVTGLWVNRNIDLDTRLCPKCRLVYREPPSLPGPTSPSPPSPTPPTGGV